MGDRSTLGLFASNLLAFEAAARLGSFTRAAEELGVSQPAISHRIRQLEEHLETRLFLRHGRGIALTSDGAELLHEVQGGLNRMLGSLQALRRKSREARRVTLLVSSAFAAFWLLPRVGRFRQAHPEIDLRILTSERPVDLVAENVSLAVRSGLGDWPDLEATLLARETILPVCSPAFLLANGRPRRSADLLGERLIDLHEPHHPHTTWADWFRALGITEAPRAPILAVNDYSLALQAALAGEGWVLGWHHLTGDLLSAGRLVAPLPDRLDTGRGFWLVRPKAAPATAATQALRDWLVAEMAGG